MNLEEVSGYILELPDSQIKSITGLIDHKTEENMDKVIARIDSMQLQLDAKFNAYESKISSIKWLIVVSISILGAFLKFFPG